MPLHRHLIRMMIETLFKIRQSPKSKKCFRSRSQLNELYLSLHKITRNYVIHLSLHPFALDTGSKNNLVLVFFTDFFDPSFEDSVTKPFREKLRKDMDEAALSSSSPPFILTSDLVCHLTDDEIMSVVDRIVALLENDSPISDDTILRICAFHEMKLRFLYLPEIFRKAGRSTEQCFRALNTLLSLPLNNFQPCPIISLLTSRPHSLQPTLDEWDDVDLVTVGVVMPFIDGNQHSFDSAWLELTDQLLKFAISVVPQMSLCASRRMSSQLERLIAPSIKLICEYYLSLFTWKDDEKKQCEDGFIHLSRLCEQRVITQCLNRMGFFSCLVDGLLNDRTFKASECFINIFLRQARSSGKVGTKMKTLRSRVHNFLEEGWQDVLEFIIVRKTIQDRFSDQLSRMLGMMGFHGSNLNSRISWYDNH
ncbi:hypothetical protein BLNAU_3113 [Blattamonas nauphoetae]|uniref:Uncharacterized protein n=1 Tax=Blattamonas nauphoetae TaxID=2049346 RepID=A0ABQ9YE65_9EUKA|nr:hypothetical protein BLNAU_3113 [Blattamonas nauphoetae]